MEISNCCYAPPLTELDGDLGYCSECHKGAVFKEPPDCRATSNVLKAVLNEAIKGNIKAKQLMFKYMDKLTEQPN